MTSGSNRPDGRPSTLRLLHVSDLHIEKPADVRLLWSLAELARDHNAHVMVIVGDFFDHNRVSEQVLAAVLDELAAVTAQVVILPGNHDPYLPESVYSRGDFSAAGACVLRTPGGQTVEFPELDLSVWGRPHTSYDDFRPMAAIPPRGTSHWEIALAHGHLVLGPSDGARAYPITPAEIAACDRDYVALGHWDLPRDVSVGGVAAAYSGSPSRVGCWTLAELSADSDGMRRTNVKFVPTTGSR